MQEKESIKVAQCEVKIPFTQDITFRHPDGIFSLHLTTIKDSCILSTVKISDFHICHMQEKCIN